MSICPCSPDTKRAYYNQLDGFEQVFYNRHLDLFKKIQFRFFLQIGQKLLNDISPQSFAVGKQTQMSDLVSSMRIGIDFFGKTNSKRLMMMAFVDYVEKKIN